MGVRITRKFVLSRCVFCKLRRDFGFFCSVNHFSEDEVNANHNVTCWPSLAKNDSSCSRIAKEIAMVSRFFVEGRRQRLFYFFQETRMRKIIKMCEGEYCRKQDDHRTTNLETRNKENGSKSTNHESQTMTF